MPVMMVMMMDDDDVRLRSWREEIQNRNRLVDLAGRNSKKKNSTGRFGGKTSAIEIDSSIWREDIGKNRICMRDA